MIDAKLKQQLAEYLKLLQNDLEITGYVDDSDISNTLRDLLQTLNELSTRITVNFDDDAPRKPTMQIRNPDNGATVRFSGVPLGHEFTSLVLALLHLGGHTIKAEDHLKEQIKALDGELNFEVFVSLSCQTCPEVVQSLNTMAALNPNITVNTIDGAAFQQEAEDRDIMAVPTVILNGQVFSQGRMTLAGLVQKLDSKSDEKLRDELNARDPYDMLIIGAGPAGASAAMYAARKGIRVGIVADRFGGQLQDTKGIENFPSVEYTEGPKLSQDLENQVKHYGVDIIYEQRAKDIRAGRPAEVELENGAVLKSKTVIIATGASWRKLNVEGEKEYTGKGVAYCPHCDGPLFKGKRVAVIGGGNSGVEAALDLAGIVGHVTVLEFDSKLRADQVLQDQLAKLQNADVILNAATSEITGNGKKVTGLKYIDRESDASHDIELDGVFVQIGLLPNSGWLKDGELELTQYGEIPVGAHGETNLPGIFAAGDVTDVIYKQIVVAGGAGATAALGAFDYLMRYSEDDDSVKSEAA